MLELPPELDHEKLFEAEESKEEHDKADVANKHITEFDTFMLEKRIEDLQRMASHLSRIDGGLEHMKDRWQRHVYDQGFYMLCDEKLAKKTFRAIEDFIEFQKQCYDMVLRVFQRKEQ